MLYEIVGAVCQPYAALWLAMVVALGRAWRRNVLARRALRWVAVQP